MADYTKVNLKEIEDTTTSDAVEGRFARKYLDSQHLGVSYWRYAPNHRSGTGHSHREQEEAYIVVGGVRADEARRRDRGSPPVGRRPRRAADGARLRGGAGRDRVRRCRLRPARGR